MSYSDADLKRLEKDAAAAAKAANALGEHASERAWRAIATSAAGLLRLRAKGARS